VYGGGGIHAERFPESRDGIPAARLLATAPLLAFSSEIWKTKRDRGLSLNAELKDIAIPQDLRSFEGDLRRMHRLA
jgi:hypothetical protein